MDSVDYPVDGEGSTTSTLPERSSGLATANRSVHLCCELCIKNECFIEAEEIRRQGYIWLASTGFSIAVGQHEPALVENAILSQACREINIESALPDDTAVAAGIGVRGFSLQETPSSAMSSCVDQPPVFVPHIDAVVKVVAYHLTPERPEAEIQYDGQEDAVPAYQQWMLPNENLHGLWNRLHYDGSLKRTLLQYATTATLFSSHAVSDKLINWNRLILLHGPPGTGKTSLCRALAQKLSVRMSDRYRTSQLLEINAHSLFSRWFSESGKLVLKLFTTIKELLEDDSCFVCILIDEVESLSAARRVALAGNEPSDAVRVVNALLTQLDALKSFPNALVLTTSNIPEAVDPAFLDRADLKLYIPNPSEQSRYEILRECLQELVCKNLLRPRTRVPPYANVCGALSNAATTDLSDDQLRIASELLQIAKQCGELSGRTLRKLPFLAYSPFTFELHCCTGPLVRTSEPDTIPNVFSYLVELGRSVRNERIGREGVSRGSKVFL